MDIEGSSSNIIALVPIRAEIALLAKVKIVPSCALSREDTNDFGQWFQLVQGLPILQDQVHGVKVTSSSYQYQIFRCAHHRVT